MNPEPPLPNPHTPADLWAVLRDLLHWVFALMGHPEDVARKRGMKRKDRALLIAALRPAEQMLRRLLLLDALQITLPARRAQTKSRNAQPKAPPPFDPETPDQWRVSFALQEPAAPARRTRSRRRKTPALDIVAARPLAQRWEALLRAFNDPAAHALRLARLLRRKPNAVAPLRAPPSNIRYVAEECFAALATLLTPPPPITEPAHADSS